jgi:hypothetical protein
VRCNLYTSDKLLRKCAAVVTRTFLRISGWVDRNPHEKAGDSSRSDEHNSGWSTELMAAPSAQQPAQTQVRLQLSTRDEELLLPQRTGPILVPTCEAHSNSSWTTTIDGVLLSTFPYHDICSLSLVLTFATSPASLCTFNARK